MKNSIVKLKEKIGYGLGDAAFSQYWKVFSIYLAIFYTDVFGISAATVGTMLLVTRIWDTANDPIMGVLSDRTNSRWGKFRPYLLWGPIPFAAVGVLLFTTPDLDVQGKIIYAYITYTLMMMVYTVLSVPYSSLLGVMTSDTSERTTFASYRMVFAFAGSLLVVAIFQPLVDFFQNSMDVSIYGSYQWTMVVVGVISTLFFLATFSWTKERITPPKDQKTNLKEDLKGLMNNTPWFIILGAGVMTLIFNSVRDGAALYYFKYYIIDDTAMSFSTIAFAYSTLYLLLGQAANIGGVVMAKPISARIGKKKTFVYAMFIAAVFSVLFYFIDRENYILIYILQIIISFFAGMVFPLLWSMYADAADYSEFTTGRRATGLVFSASSMSQKLGWTLGGSITLWLLAFYSFEANTEQSHDTIEGIKYMLSFIPAVGALLSGIIMMFYKLSDSKMSEISNELDKRRLQG
jgi:GPH family glycoside/pentoside/hexuronide:cation symporter